MQRIWVLRLVSITAFLLGQIMLYLIEAPIYAQVLYGVLFIGMLIGYRYNYYIFIIRVVTPITIGFNPLRYYHRISPMEGAHRPRQPETSY